MLVGAQHNARIDSDPIIVFVCCILASDHQRIAKIFNYKFFCVLQINAMQGLASYCELGLIVKILTSMPYGKITSKDQHTNQNTACVLLYKNSMPHLSLVHHTPNLRVW